MDQNSMENIDLSSQPSDTNENFQTSHVDLNSLPSKFEEEEEKQEQDQNQNQNSQHDLNSLPSDIEEEEEEAIGQNSQLSQNSDQNSQLELNSLPSYIEEEEEEHEQDIDQKSQLSEEERDQNSEYSDYSDYEDEDEPEQSFDETYLCFSLSSVDKSHLEDGNKIIMPESALHTLVSRNLVPLNPGYPMLFQIRNPNFDRVSHCGVLEFSSEQDSVFLPNWMMKNMRLEDGEHVNIKYADLPKGTYMKIQPHSVKFITSFKDNDPKDVLETILRDFSCLTIGDTITINHESLTFKIDVIEAEPNDAICIIDTDCRLEFAPPLDYKEPEKKPKEEVEPEQASKEDTIFQPFIGVARRLKEPPAAAEKAATLADASSESTAGKRNGKVVFGRDDGVPLPKKIAETKVTEKSEQKKFQPFTGKKYSLRG